LAYSQFRYAVSLSLEKRPCVVVGGGKVALRKARSLLEAGAVLTVIAPALDTGFATLKKEWPSLVLLERPYRAGDLKGAFLVIAATDNRTVNQAAAAEAMQRHCLLNVVDNPETGNFSVPGSYETGQVRFAVSTGGNPRFTHLLLTDLAAQYGPDIGAFAAYLDIERERVKQRIPDSDARRKFWRAILKDDLLEELRTGHLEQVKERIANEIDRCRAES
jgi:precorrin-2 dehydrogenase/sirohydrochlorin ferrochelatase